MPACIVGAMHNEMAPPAGRDLQPDPGSVGRRLTGAGDKAFSGREGNDMRSHHPACEGWRVTRTTTMPAATALPVCLRGCTLKYHRRLP